MTAAATRGTFAGFSLVPSRGVLKLTIEVPIHEAAAALATLGIPDPKEAPWVAVALLDPGKVESGCARPPATETENQADLSTEAKTGRNWHELKLSNQAGIACDDTLFKTFMIEQHRNRSGLIFGNNGTLLAAASLRSICNVESRSEFDTDEEAGKRWTALYKSYQAWKELG